jgi:hypothetical protein
VGENVASRGCIEKRFVFLCDCQNQILRKIYFTVTNDLVYDQRMQRICTSLAENDFDVVLIGRKLGHSLPLEKKR